MSARLPPVPWTFETSSGRVRDANGDCIIQIFEDALVRPVMAISSPQLVADCNDLAMGAKAAETRITRLGELNERIINETHARIRRLEACLKNIRDSTTRRIIPWTHEAAADEFSRVLSAHREIARLALEPRPSDFDSTPKDHRDER